MDANGKVITSISEAYQLDVFDIVDLIFTLQLLGRAISDVDVWRGDYKEFIPEILSKGMGLQDLAIRLLSSQEANWWFAEEIAPHQLWSKGAGNAGNPAPPVIPHRSPTQEERYAQKPNWGLFTSTEFEGISSYVVSSANSLRDAGPLELPFPRYRIKPSNDARVFNIDSPRLWHQLCREYPANEKGGFFGERRTPDFVKVSRDWDAVHLTSGGLLVSDQVAVSGPKGTTELPGWDAEETVWFRWTFSDVYRLEGLEKPPVTPLNE